MLKCQSVCLSVCVDVDITLMNISHALTQKHIYIYPHK